MIEPPPPVDHGGDRVLAAEEHAAHVDGHDRVPGRDVGVDHRVIRLGHDPGVVVEAVDAAVGRERVIDHRLGVGLVRDVGLDEASPRRRPSRTRRTVSCPAASPNSATTTLAPSLAKIWEATRPIPPPAPVMIVTLSASRIGASSVGVWPVLAPAAGASLRSTRSPTRRRDQASSVRRAGQHRLDDPGRRLEAPPLLGRQRGDHRGQRRDAPVATRQEDVLGRVRWRRRGPPGGRPDPAVARRGRRRPCPATRRVMVGGVTPSIAGQGPDRSRATEDQDRQRRQSRRRDAGRPVLLGQATKQVKRRRMQSSRQFGVIRSRTA